jgi:hypothetical protein
MASTAAHEAVSVAVTLFSTGSMLVCQLSDNRLRELARPTDQER